jgi:hypothetical protein
MLYTLESTRPSLWLILFLVAMCFLLAYTLTTLDELWMVALLAAGGFFVLLGTLHQIYLFISGKTLSVVETRENSLVLTYHNGKSEEIQYKDISTVMVIPSPTMVARKYWLLNFWVRHRKSMSMKFWDEKTVRDIAKTINKHS